MVGDYNVIIIKLYYTFIILATTDDMYQVNTQDKTIKAHYIAKSIRIGKRQMLDVEVLDKVNYAIADLEGSLRSQTNIDIAFTGWYDTVQQEMHKRLPSRSAHCGVNNRKGRVKKNFRGIMN